MDLSLSLERLSAWVDRHGKTLLGLLLVVASLDFVTAAWRVPFWGDEFFTFYIARLDGFGAIVKAAPADGQPPIYYWLAHLSQGVLGPTAFATRLPSLLAFFAALVCVYVFVRRRCPALGALFAVSAVCTAGIAGYAHDARPYALMLFFTAFALVNWQSAVERSSGRLLPLALMAVGIAGAIGSHHFGVLSVGLPLAVGEAWRLGKTRCFDWPVYVAGLAGAATLALTLPLMTETAGALLDHVRAAPQFFGKISLARLGEAAWLVNLPVVAGFLALSAALGQFLPGKKPASLALPAHEIAAAAGLCLLLPAATMAAWLHTGYFQLRYAICASLGIAILLGFAVASNARPMRGATIAALICLPLFWFGHLRMDVSILRGRHVAEAYSPPRVLSPVPADLPIVVANTYEYPELWFYAPDALRRQLYVLTDRQWALTRINPLPEMTLAGERAFLPFRLEDYGSFVGRNAAFYVYATEDDGWNSWVRERLLAEGWALTVVREAPKEILFSATRR